MVSKDCYSLHKTLLNCNISEDSLQLYNKDTYMQILCLNVKIILNDIKNKFVLLQLGSVCGP